MKSELITFFSSRSSQLPRFAASVASHVTKCNGRSLEAQICCPGSEWRAWHCISIIYLILLCSAKRSTVAFCQVILTISSQVTKEREDGSLLSPPPPPRPPLLLNLSQFFPAVVKIPARSKSENTRIPNRNSG